MAGKSSEATGRVVSIASVLGAAGARTAYEKLLLIREFENKVYDSFVAGLVQGTTHLCQGQEAVSVGTVMALRDDDYLTYTYRGHGPCIARGMDLEGAFAEIFGRSTGVSGGLGGSMHLTDMQLGLLGSFAIVGAGLPVAVGAGISARERGIGQVSMTWFGDGATNIGAFHESMNLAAVWKLPVIFVCENNLYGEYSPILSTTPMQDLVVRASAYAMPGVVVDGNDVVAVLDATRRAVARARAGDGPTFIECKTYRQCGHSRSDAGKYRPPGELDAWMERDPIVLFRNRLLAEGLLDKAGLAATEQRVREEVQAAAARAAEGPWPEVRPLHDATYAGTLTA
ncbi:MAG: thiamine pyrophosphate-dependent dehydrogenase E1 component subunit alpha [Steroidobacteraceae bacterium]|nr:thiamine pyrophosphate-dependent dehydrogenase E1 component subunit alpha [Steroidobacteraceae bacterium]